MRSWQAASGECCGRGVELSRRLMMLGVKVDVVRDLMGAVERGWRGCVTRCLVERVCLDAAPCCEMNCSVCLRMGGRHVFERNGERGEHLGD